MTIAPVELLVFLLPLAFVALCLLAFYLLTRGIGSRIESFPPPYGPDGGPLHGEASDGLPEPGGPWTAPRPVRPWWGHPLLWLAIGAVFLLLGLFVAPHFLPGVVLFLPFIWVGGWRMTGQPRPRCTACGNPLASGHAYCPRCGTPVQR